MRGPQAKTWIQAILEEIVFLEAWGVRRSLQRLCDFFPLPARLILVTKPNVHGGPARKKARAVIYGNFQEVHPDEVTASKTPA